MSYGGQATDGRRATLIMSLLKKRPPLGQIIREEGHKQKRGWGDLSHYFAQCDQAHVTPALPLPEPEGPLLPTSLLTSQRTSPLWPAPALLGHPAFP